MVRDNAAEVYQKVGAVRITVGLLCALVAAFIILVTLLILYREGRELMIMENAIRRLGNLELSADKELEGFCERTDEIGMIAQTIHHVCDCLRKTIDNIGRILGEMANGNIAVDVAKNESYYIGDFKVLAESLKCIHANLTDVMRRITQIANQVFAGAQALSQGTIQQKDSINGLVSNVADITTQIQNSTVRCSDARNLVDRATGYAAEADTRMTQLIAAIEAARAGAAGKGFSVVSDEVKNLASKSAEAAKNTGSLIGLSVRDVQTGTESTNLAISAMQVTNDCIQSIKTLMDEISLASVQQSEMILSIESRIKEVSKVIDANSSSAEESAEVSNELSNQARSLNLLIGQFRI